MVRKISLFVLLALGGLGLLGVAAMVNAQESADGAPHNDTLLDRIRKEIVGETDRPSAAKSRPTTKSTTKAQPKSATKGTSKNSTNAPAWGSSRTVPAAEARAAEARVSETRRDGQATAKVSTQQAITATGQSLEQRLKTMRGTPSSSSAEERDSTDEGAKTPSTTPSAGSRDETPPLRTPAQLSNGDDDPPALRGVDDRSAAGRSAIDRGTPDRASKNEDSIPTNPQSTSSRRTIDSPRTDESQAPTADRTTSSPRIASSANGVVSRSGDRDTRREPSERHGQETGPQPGRAVPQPGRAVPQPVLATSNSPRLAVKTTGPRTVTIGKQATYQLILDNSGDAAASGVVVTIKLPPWAEVVASHPSAGEATASRKSDKADETESFQWRVGRVEAGGQQQLALEIVPRKSRPFALGVEWTFVPEAAQTVVEVQEPKLQIAISGPDEMLYGATEVYKLTVSNPGTGDAENVAVRMVTSGKEGTGKEADGADRHAIGTIAAGDSKILNVRLTATQSGSLTVKAQATGDGGLVADVAEQVLVRRAALKIEAAGPATKYSGATATYKFRVSNPGNATAENVRVEALLPAGAKYVANGGGGTTAGDRTKIEWAISSLRASMEQRFEVTCTLIQPGANQLRVNVGGEGKLSDAASVATQVEALADLKLEVSDPQGPIPVGEEMTYEIRLKNRGSKSAEGIGLVGYFSEGVEPIKAHGATAKLGSGQVTFDPIAKLGAGEELVLKITARASAPGNHVFRAELACGNPQTRLVGEETTPFFGERETTTAPSATPAQSTPGPSTPAPSNPSASTRSASAPATLAPSSGSAPKTTLRRESPIPDDDRYDVAR